MMFTIDEVQALVLGARMVETWADDELRQAARAVLDKVEAVLPPKERRRLSETALFALSFRVTKKARANMAVLRKAVHDRRVVTIAYLDQAQTQSERRLRPLGLYFWGHTWTLGAWCELRSDFRNFRLDRIERLELTDETFDHEPPVTLDSYLRAMTTDDDGAQSED
jgi:predicted DNA-binding transcriptional regulator YafY